jgi:preprotein translocase subunit SecY
MSFLDTIIANIPEIRGPTQKKLSFKEKAKWTLIILVLYFVLGNITLIGLSPAAQFQFEQIAVILGAVFGSIISLGIGPIVTASIVLQLLNGSGLVNFDTTSDAGKKKFQGTQKLLSVFFVIFEAFVFVFFGGFEPVTKTLSWEIILILQLFVGGLIIMYMDETVQKWGFGNGLSLFIVAGVAQTIFVQAFSPFDSEGFLIFLGGDPANVVGRVWYFLMFIANNDPEAWLAIAAIIATFVVFAVSVYTQAMRVEIPLSFGRVRGYGLRWPLRFMYTSNIPVILVAALLANIQLLVSFLNNRGITFLGVVGPGGAAQSGFVTFVSPVQIVQIIVQTGFSGLTGLDFARAVSYAILMILGAVMFSVFWVQSSGQDAKSVAKQIMASGLQIPGFRRDPRLLERILQRYIGPLSVMGGVAVGILAALADLTGALSRGTGILLAVMITYQLYEEIAKQHAMDMHPAMRKFVGG